MRLRSSPCSSGGVATCCCPSPRKKSSCDWKNPSTKQKNLKLHSVSEFATRCNAAKADTYAVIRQNMSAYMPQAQLLDTSAQYLRGLFPLSLAVQKNFTHLSCRLQGVLWGAVIREMTLAQLNKSLSAVG